MKKEATPQIKWLKDSYIDLDGKEWALSLPWTPECAQDWSFPTAGLLSVAERAKAWENHRYTDARIGSGEFMDEIEKRRQERNAALREYERQRKLEATQKIKDAHPDEKYVKGKGWVPKVEWFTCPMCSGAGRHGENLCPRCFGEGKVHT